MQNFILVLNKLAVDPCLGQYVWIRMTLLRRNLLLVNDVGNWVCIPKVKSLLL